ncbi:MAG: dockerin type I repeat-containing protein [Clostridia bacterium]|nr:dockerin type I repeat-containing protein [Clostridia bacterium]
MRKFNRIVCVFLALVLLCGATAAAAEHTVSDTALKVGTNRVTADGNIPTIFKFKPTAVGNYRVAVDDPSAVLNFWYGSSQYVSMPARDAVDGAVTVTCTSVGQSLLIGLSGVTSATVTITKQNDYVPPVKVVYTTYRNQHTPSSRFQMTSEKLTAVDITRPQTVVADADGVYHLGSVSGPVLYVDLRASVWTDLYKLFYPDPVEGEEWPPIDVMRGRYSETRGYDFLEAMADYADALDGNYYYLTVDLAKYMQCYGTDQGWYIPRYSPYEPIRQGAFIEESAWLVNTYYVAPAVAVGDVNGDGNLNNRDLALLQKFLNDWPVTVEQTGADVNGDGKINNRDLSALQRKLNS